MLKTNQINFESRMNFRALTTVMKTVEDQDGKAVNARNQTAIIESFDETKSMEQSIPFRKNIGIHFAPI